MNLQETIRRVLKGVAKKLSNKLHCDRHGSCVHFAELFVEEINNTHPELLKEFDVIEGYVDVKFGEGKPQEHTWIRLSNDEVIDPTFIQFTKYDKNAKYSRKRTKSYTGQEYYDEGVKGSWFSKRRKEQPDTVFKGRLQESIRKILREELLNESKFFHRRVNLDKVQKLLSINAEQVYHETKSYEQFKYELTLKSVEQVLWNEYELGWENLPEQEEIEFVNKVSDMFEKYIKQLYNNIQESIRRIIRNMNEEIEKPQYQIRRERIQKLVDDILNDMKRTCEIMNSEDDEIISFGACDLIDADVKVSVSEVAIVNDRKRVLVVIKYYNWRYLSEDEFVYELSKELRKWIGDNYVEVEDYINTYPPEKRQW